MENSVKKSKFSIVNLICATLKLGDFGKVDSFISKVVRTLNREIETFKRNKSAIKYTEKGRISEYKEELEDAQVALEDAYSNINPENLKTNDAQKRAMVPYLEHIDACEEECTCIEKKIEDYKETMKKEIKAIDENIAWREVRVKKLSLG